MTDTDTIGQKAAGIVRLSLELIRDDWRSYGGLLTGLVLVSSLTDFYIDPKLTNLIGGMGMFALGGYINFAALERLCPFDPPKALRLISLFGLSLVSALGMLLGFIALILPALFLYLRWFIAWPILVQENIGIIAALRQSWREMKGWELPALIVCIIPVAVMFLGLLVLVLSGYDPDRPNSFVGAFGSNFFSFFPLSLFYIAAVVCYRQTQGADIHRDTA